MWQAVPARKLSSVTDAAEREAGEIITDEGDAHTNIVEFLAELKII